MLSLFMVLYTFMGVVCFSILKEHYEKRYHSTLSRSEEWVLICASVFWLVTMLLLLVWYLSITIKGYQK